jgi:hypothetical protein
MLRRSTALLVSLAALASCSNDPGAEAPTAGGAPTDEEELDELPATPPELDRAALEALGYVLEADGPAPAASGVTLHVPERAHQGYTLVTPLQGASELVAMDGRVVARFDDPEGRRWTRAELMPSGDLVAIASVDANPTADPDAQPFLDAFVVCLDFDGNERWRLPGYPHHDVSPTNDGHIGYVDKEVRTRGKRSLSDDIVVVVDGNGAPISRHPLLMSVLNHLGPDVIEGRRFERRVATASEEVLHVNSVDWLPFPDLVGSSPIHTPTTVLVSLRNLNLIAAFDLATDTIVWTWGTDELQRQHEATFLANGNVLVFDNGERERGYSRVIEVDPRSGEIVWQYVAPDPKSFFSYRRGTAQGLPNGNVLVCSSQQGRVFEVTREGEVVWDYTTPVRGPNGGVSAIRTQRYDAAFVDALLARRGTGSGGADR